MLATSRGNGQLMWLLESGLMGGQRLMSAPQVAYGRDAFLYDGRTAAYGKYRRATVDLLSLQRGDVVLDVGCGTGLCFDLLLDAVGPTGRVIGIDESAPMLELAAERVRQHNWDNVTLMRRPVESADIRETADAALLCATHDVLRSRPALANVFRHLRPGALVAASGGKWATTWKAAVNACVRVTHEPFVSSFEGFSRPWSILADSVDDLRVVEVAFGGGYLAAGRVPGSADRGPARTTPMTSLHRHCR